MRNLVKDAAIKSREVEFGTDGLPDENHKFTREEVGSRFIAGRAK